MTALPIVQEGTTQEEIELAERLIDKIHLDIIDINEGENKLIYSGSLSGRGQTVFDDDDNTMPDYLDKDPQKHEKYFDKLIPGQSKFYRFIVTVPGIMESAEPNDNEYMSTHGMAFEWYVRGICKEEHPISPPSPFDGITTPGLSTVPSSYDGGDHFEDTIESGLLGISAHMGIISKPNEVNPITGGSD
jgi:hypothetical protein